MGRSLSTRVVALVLAAILLAWLAAAAFSYQRVRHEADELLDGYLAQAAAMLLARVGEHEDVDDLELEHAPELHRYARRLAFQVWEHGTRLRLHSANAPDTRLSPLDAGFDDVAVDGVRYRVFSNFDRQGRTLVQVAEASGARAEVSGSIARALAPPLAVVLLLLAPLVWLAVRAGLAPLRALGNEVGARSPENLSAIGIERPSTEIAPLVAELNRLFARLRDSIDHERRFTADAAHELRTPIAALRVQAQVARAADDHATRTHALEGVLAGCDRAARLVDQMLTLARIESLPGVAVDAPLDLGDVVRGAAAEIAPWALERGIEVEVEVEPAPAQVRGDPALLAILMRNLLDNAVRYSVGGGAVRARVAVGAGRHARLEVEDEGPGIPSALLGRLGDRFVRGQAPGASGSGLGLSIVSRVAALHGASIAFGEGRDGRGLRVRLDFPPAADG